MIDFHTHLAYHKLYPDKFLEGMFASAEKGGISTQKVTSVVKLFLKDQEGVQLLKQMDSAEIEKAVLLIVDDFAYLGKTEISIDDNYKLHHKVLKRHPDRFIVFGGIHPGRGKDGMNLLKLSIEKYGFRGIKLYPPFGFKMDDERLTNFYEYSNTNKLPILIHTGFSLNDLENENAEPDTLLVIAEQYRKIRFIMAHAGYKLNNPMVTRLLQKENVFADISGFQSILHSENAKYELSLIFQKPFNKKLLFGSDWPITNIMKSLSDQVNVLKEICKGCENKAEGAFENIMKLNAEKLLNSCGF